MIRYPITRAELEQRISQISPTWLTRARERTEAFRRAGKYEESSSIWGEIKALYMQLQHNKCAYCESRLEGGALGAIQHDLEHYRPKKGVKKWPDPDKHPHRYPFLTGDEWSEGYFLLAYHPLNYVTACKSCNSPLKANYFPIAHARGPQHDEPQALQSESPYLPYPLSDVDDDPETLLTFAGILAEPASQQGQASQRARVTIDFFDLNGRESLRRERAEQLQQLWFALLVARIPPTPEAAELAQSTIARLTHPASPHCNCARSFLRLAQADPAKARAIALAVKDYLDSLVV